MDSQALHEGQFEHSRTRHYYVNEDEWSKVSPRADYHPFFPRFNGRRKAHPLSNDSTRTMGCLTCDPWSDTSGMGRKIVPQAAAPVAKLLNGHSAVLSRPGVEEERDVGCGLGDAMEKPKAKVQALTKNRIAFLAARALADGWASSHAKAKAATTEKEEMHHTRGALGPPPEIRGKYFAADKSQGPIELPAPALNVSYGPRPTGGLERHFVYAEGEGGGMEASGMKTEFAMRAQSLSTKPFRTTQ